MTRWTPATVCGLLLTCATATSPPCLAAQMSVGANGGLVSTTLTGAEAEALNAGSKLGIMAGLWVALPVLGRVSVQPGVYLVEKGASFAEAGGSGTLNVSYLEVPLLVSFSLTGPDSPILPRLLAGPAVAFETGCSADATAGGFTVRANCGPADQDERQTLDLGAYFGAAVEFPINEMFSFMLSGGANFGLRKLDTGDNPVDTKNRAFFGSFSSVFPIGG